MENQNYKVTISGKEYFYEQGTSYEEIAEEFQKEYEHQIALVMVDGYRLQELNKTVTRDCELKFITTQDTAGFDTYRRSVCFLFVKAVHDVIGHENPQNVRVRIHCSLGAGFYCTIEGLDYVGMEFQWKVEERMHELVQQKIPIMKEQIHVEEALELFHKYGMFDKERLFRYRRSSHVNLYSMNEFRDYYYGYMMPDTGSLKYFALYLYHGGIVLQMPLKDNPEKVPLFTTKDKLFKVLSESIRWGDQQGIDTVGALNDMVTQDDMREIVLVQEAYQERKIGEIAEQIADRPGVKFVLIAGPSSSGKTTFSHRLSIQLRVNGLHPHPISVDNYFVDREKTPKDKDGNYNFECIEAIDVEKFNEDMSNLLAGKEVYLPIFDFKSGKRTYETKPTKLGENDILVIEGIHCLNPKLTEHLCDDRKFRIYISALTQLNIDEHNRIPSTDGRLIRRIVRDARTRGASATKTISMWPSVRKGEEENIFPYQEYADVMFDSSLTYELAVLKQYVEPLLLGVSKELPEYLEAKRLLKFLDYFVGIGTDNVPMLSLIHI